MNIQFIQTLQVERCHMPVEHHYNKPITHCNNTNDSVNFRGYNSTLKKIAKREIKNDNQVKEYFDLLFKNIKNSTEIIKKPEFEFIEKTYKENGFKGLLQELWKSNQTKEVEELINASQGKNIILAESQGKPVFLLQNHGKHGFSGAMTNSKTNTNNINLTFISPEETPSSFSVRLKEKGNLETSQGYDEISKYTDYYLSSGTRKRTIVQNGIFDEKIYYNKDGTRPFFKNLFFGGTW